MKPALINLWAPAGVGKSRTQASLFHIMKMAGYRVEAPYEFAKELAYQGNRKAMMDPLFVTGVQEHRNWACIGQVDYIISDSPTGISLVYIEPGHELYDAIGVVAMDARTRYRCFDIRLTRVADRPYEDYGRVHTEEESRALDREVDHVLSDLAGRPVPKVPADHLAAKTILEYVQKELAHGR